MLTTLNFLNPVHTKQGNGEGGSLQWLSLVTFFFIVGEYKSRIRVSFKVIYMCRLWFFEVARDDIFFFVKR